jgi:hypothetical protein
LEIKYFSADCRNIENGTKTGTNGKFG